MALTCAQICERARNIAKCPGFTVQSGQYLNSVLQSLAESYDFDVNKVGDFTVTTGTGVVAPQGPYTLPTNYLRACPREVNFLINGEPFILTQFDMATFRAQFTGPGITNYPSFFATDFSTVQSLGYPVAYLWPPVSGAYVITWPYFKAHEDITSPETSTTVPWFPNSEYLYTAVAGELMGETDDERASAYNDPDNGKAAKILRHYLQMKDDRLGYSQRVQLDPNNFRSTLNTAPTKQTVW
jgi:hypothetical protein